MDLTDLILAILEEVKKERPDLIESITTDGGNRPLHYMGKPVFKIRMSNSLCCNIPISPEFSIYKDIISKYDDKCSGEHGTLPISIGHPEFVDMFKDAIVKWLQDNYNLSMGY